MELSLNFTAKRRVWSAALLMAALNCSSMVHANNSLDRVVVVVDSTAILQSDIDRAIQDARGQLQARSQAIPSDAVLQAEVTRQLILRNIQLGLIKRAGLTVDERSLNAALADLAEKQNAPSLSAFQQALDQRQAGSYARLRQQMSEDLSINRLRQQQIGSRIKISDRAIDNFLASPQSQLYLSDELRTAHFLVKLPEQPTPDE